MNATRAAKVQTVRTIDIMMIIVIISHATTFFVVLIFQKGMIAPKMLPLGPKLKLE